MSVCEALDKLFNISPTHGEVQEPSWEDWTSVGGFQGLRHTEESKALMSAAKLGKPGHKHTQKTKELLAQKSSGVKQTSQTIAKRVASNKGQKRTEQQRKNLSEGHRGRVSFSMVSPTGKVHKVTHLSKFCRQYKLNPSNISKVVKGERLSHKGWRKS